MDWLTAATQESLCHGQGDQSLPAGQASSPTLNREKRRSTSFSRTLAE
jgi:hypothetical protein